MSREAHASDASSVDDCAVSDVRADFENDSHAGEHVHDAVFLDVASVFDDDSAPVTADCCAGADVDIASDDDIAGDRCIWMHVGRFVDDRFESLEFEDVRRGQTLSMIVAIPWPTPMHIVQSAYCPPVC